MSKQLTIIHTESSPNWGGQEQRVFSELVEMKKRGHCVILISSEKSRLSESCLRCGIRVYPLSFKNTLFVPNIFKLKKIFEFHKADVVNPHSSKDGWVSIIAARLARVPCIIRSRHIEVDYPNYLISQYAFRKLPHHVITTSERIRQRLIKELRVEYNRIDTIATGLDFERFQSGLEKGKLKKELGISNQKRIIGMISVLRSWKGHRYFLEAAKQLLNEFDDLHFVIVGDGPQKRDIQMLIKELRLEKEITLLGHRDDIPDILTDYDLLILPSTGQEGIPQIILQAHAMKTPVIASKTGGIPEVIEEGETGRLVTPENSMELASAISLALKNYSMCINMAKKASLFVKDGHSVKEMGNRLELIYAKYVPDYRPILL